MRKPLRRISDLYHLADTMEQRGFLICRLVAIGIRALGIRDIEVMATDLQMNSNRPEVVKLIQMLLDEEKSRKARLSTVDYESVYGLEETLALASRATVLRPMIYLSAARVADVNTPLRLGVAQTNWPAAQTIYGQSALPAAPFSTTLDPRVPRLSRFADLSVGLRGSDRYLNTEFRILAEMRTAAISLAVNLYRADHQRWPADLKSLVPTYLPFVPEDPFYASPHPIGYMILNGSRPLLFFDTNGIPSLSSPPTKPSFDWDNFNGARQWCDITNWWQTPASK